MALILRIFISEGFRGFRIFRGTGVTTPFGEIGLFLFFNENLRIMLSPMKAKKDTPGKGVPLNLMERESRPFLLLKQAVVVDHQSEAAV